MSCISICSAVLLSQQVDYVYVSDVCLVDTIVDAGFQEPGDELALVIGHALDSKVVVRHPIRIRYPVLQTHPIVGVSEQGNQEQL